MSLNNHNFDLSVEELLVRRQAGDNFTNKFILLLFWHDQNNDIIFFIFLYC
jgi:hypothetical protein